MASTNEVSHKACVLTSHGADLVEETRIIKLDELAGEEVLITTKAAGVCHSDVHFWHGVQQIGQTKDEVVTFAERGLTLPRVPGHEIAGEVLAMGVVAKDVSGLMVGDRVLVYPWVGCGVCVSGDPQLCSRSSQDLGFVLDGGFSERVRVPNHRYVFKLPDCIPYEMAALLPCGALTAYTAVKKIRSVIEELSLRRGEQVCVGVIGLGGLGQWCLKLLQHVYKETPLQIIGIDVARAKTEQALKLNLAHRVFVLDKETTVKEQAANFLRMFDNNRFNCILDFVNTTETFSFAAGLLCKSGVLVCVGLHGGLGQIQLPYIVVQNITITSAYTGSLSSMTELLDIVTSNPIDPPSITRYPRHLASRALRDLAQGLIMGRGVLTY